MNVLQIRVKKLICSTFNCQKQVILVAVTNDDGEYLTINECVGHKTVTFDMSNDRNFF